ncbi:MAG: glycosyltransferase family 1 protein, partial [Chloroflexota bacterium]
LIYPEYHRSVGAKLYNALVSASAKGASHILADSNTSKYDIVSRLEIPEEDVTTVYLAPAPGYSPDGDFLVDMAIQQKYNLPDFYTLYFGGFTLHKNVHTMLLAFTYVNKGLGDDHKLVLGGEKPTKVGPNSLDYVKYIKDLGLEEHVVWIGLVEEADKPVIYREALNFVFPSKYEGFGLPPLEAMASGVPVVATDSPGVSEVVGNAAAAPDADDERQMGGAMIATAHQESYRQDLIEKGKIRVAEFSWEKTVGQTVAVYAQTVDKMGG